MPLADNYWGTEEPLEWPSPPQQFSYSTLSDIEGCPRRWSLRNGLYGSTEMPHRYPRKIQVSALAGTVVHATLDDLVTAIGLARCQGPDDVVDVLRGIGGISHAIEMRAKTTLQGLAANPRMKTRLAEFEHSLRRQVPEMRGLVQSALARVIRSGPIHPPRSGSSHDSDRGPLGPGLHPEVKLAPLGMSWVGWADAIRLGDSVCEIIDYKSGALASSHHEQLRIYALLWARDRKLNPTGRQADTLTLVYPEKTETWPAPDDRELQDLEQALVDRVAKAAVQVAQSPPPARVGAETCRFCDVKQLCGPYWSPIGQQALREPVTPVKRSMQAVINGRRANRAWELLIELDPELAAGQSATLVSEREAQFSRGDRLRLVDVMVSGDQGLTPTVTFTSRSEVFEVS